MAFLKLFMRYIGDSTQFWDFIKLKKGVSPSGVFLNNKSKSY